MKKRVMINMGQSKPDANTLLLLHCEDFKDSSIYNRIITNYNTTISPSGKFSKCFDFSSEKKVLIPDEVLTDRINEDWTIDFWLYRRSTANNTPIISAWGNGNYVLLLINNGNTLSLHKGTSWGSANEIGSIKASTNVWQHIAIVNKSNTIKAYLNGVLQCSGYADTGSEANLYVNYKEDTRNYSSFLFDEFRISDIARWTSNFTPPTKPY